jgi:hypothetical protein
LRLIRIFVAATPIGVELDDGLPSIVQRIDADLALGYLHRQQLDALGSCLHRRVNALDPLLLQPRISLRSDGSIRFPVPFSFSPLDPTANASHF